MTRTNDEKRAAYRARDEYRRRRHRRRVRKVIGWFILTAIGALILTSTVIEHGWAPVLFTAVLLALVVLGICLVES